MPKENPLASLLNRELGSIEFVMDYYQFRFSGPLLTVFTKPELIIDRRLITIESPEFCHLLLKCIGKTVVDATVEEGNAIKITFNNGFLFRISLKPEDYTAAEAVIFDNKPDDWWVW